MPARLELALPPADSGIPIDTSMRSVTIRNVTPFSTRTAAMPHKRKPNLSSLENRVMGVIWQRGQVTAELVRTELNPTQPMKDSTVRTILAAWKKKVTFGIPPKAARTCTRLRWRRRTLPPTPYAASSNASATAAWRVCWWAWSIAKLSPPPSCKNSPNAFRPIGASKRENQVHV